MEDMFCVFDTSGNLLWVVKTLDDVERDPEGHKLGSLVDNVVGTVEDQVPENSGDNLYCRKCQLKRGYK